MAKIFRNELSKIVLGLLLFIPGAILSHLGFTYLSLSLLLLTLLPAVKGVSFSLGISLLLRTLIPVFSIMGAKIGLRQKAKHRRKR